MGRMRRKRMLGKWERCGERQESENESRNNFSSKILGRILR